MSETGLLDPASIRKIAESIGLKPTKTKGQNFVHDPNTVRRIVSLAEVDQSDVVLEIGPGLGSLTLALLETGAQVVTVEIDQLLAKQLPLTVVKRSPEAAPRLHPVTADALQITELPLAPTKIVANLPYNVSVPVLIHLMETFDSWNQALVMVQLEVADRLAAVPGTKSYGAPSAKVAWFAEATRVSTVSRKIFWPVPNVDSGLVKIVKRTQLGSADQRRKVFEVVDAAFNQRRKMLRSALSGIAGSAELASQACTLAGIDPQLRGEKLTIGQFAELAKALGDLEAGQLGSAS